MSTINSRLPVPMVGLAYLAGGVALSVSWSQLRQVLQMQGRLPAGDYISVALPLAILFGGCVLWRMLGHLFNRAARAKTFGPAMVFVLFGALLNEGVSITTSAMSLTLGVNHRLAQDVQNSEQYKASAALTDSTTAAAQRLAQNLQNMPSNYITKGNETAASLERLLTAQAKLSEQANSTDSSITQRTLDEFGATLNMTGEQLKTRWSWLLALCLSVIVMALQIGLGTLSDGTLAEKQKSNDGIMGTTAKK